MDFDSDYDLIISNIEYELGRLKEINKNLRKENQFLRNKIGIAELAKTEDISLEEVFTHLEIHSDTCGLKTKAYVRLNQMGVQRVNDFKRFDFESLISQKQVGALICTVIIIILEHYGVKIELKSFCYEKIVKQIESLLPVYRKKIEFTD